MELRAQLSLPFGIFRSVALGRLAAQLPQNPLTNRGEIRMVKHALPESVILSAMQTGPTNFDTSVDRLIARHKAGVTKKVRAAILAAGANRQPQVSVSPATSPQGVPAVRTVTPGPPPGSFTSGARNQGDGMIFNTSTQRGHSRLLQEQRRTDGLANSNANQ